ncbi:MRPS35 isoform 4, partial [Pongo abelii]
AAAALPAWLSLQSRARTLRAFSTAVYPATPVPTSGSQN